MAIEMTPVTNTRSKNIVAAGYDPDEQTMRVEFDNGTRYDYVHVSPEVYQTFREAPGAGEYLDKVIKMAHPAHKLKDSEE